MVKKHKGLIAGSTFLVLHNLDLAFNFSDNILLLNNGDQQFLEYEIFPENNAIPGTLKVEINNQEAFAINTIDYDHIAHQTWFPKAKLKLAYFKLNIPSKKIGYFMGAGDLVPKYLKILNQSLKFL